MSLRECTALESPFVSLTQSILSIDATNTTRINRVVGSLESSFLDPILFDGNQPEVVVLVSSDLSYSKILAGLLYNALIFRVFECPKSIGPMGGSAQVVSGMMGFPEKGLIACVVIWFWCAEFIWMACRKWNCRVLVVYVRILHIYVSYIYGRTQFLLRGLTTMHVSRRVPLWETLRPPKSHFESHRPQLLLGTTKYHPTILAISDYSWRKAVPIALVFPITTESISKKHNCYDDSKALRPTIPCLFRARLVVPHHENTTLWRRCRLHCRESGAWRRMFLACIAWFGRWDSAWKFRSPER